MQNIDWVKEFPASITVCDIEGVILYMNDLAIEVFKDDGGVSLIGTNLLECHPEPSRTKLKNMLKSGMTNTYSTLKNDKKKIIHQAPWFINNEYKGFVEIAFEVPLEIPTFIR
jgi:DUF438 domain-containing protein